MPDTPDLSEVSTEDLLAARSGDLSKVSTEGLMRMRGMKPAAPTVQPVAPEPVPPTVSAAPEVDQARAEKVRYLYLAHKQKRTPAEDEELRATHSRLYYSPEGEQFRAGLKQKQQEEHAYEGEHPYLSAATETGGRILSELGGDTRPESFQYDEQGQRIRAERPRPTAAQLIRAGTDPATRLMSIPYAPIAAGVRYQKEHPNESLPGVTIAKWLPTPIPYAGMEMYGEHVVEPFKRRAEEERVMGHPGKETAAELTALGLEALPLFALGKAGEAVEGGIGALRGPRMGPTDITALRQRAPLPEVRGPATEPPIPPPAPVEGAMLRARPGVIRQPRALPEISSAERPGVLVNEGGVAGAGELTPAERAAYEAQGVPPPRGNISAEGRPLGQQPLGAGERLIERPGVRPQMPGTTRESAPPPAMGENAPPTPSLGAQQVPPGEPVAPRAEATLGAGLPSVPEAKGGRFNRNIESFRNQFGAGGQKMSDALGEITKNADAQYGDLDANPSRAYDRLKIGQRSAARQNLDLWVSGKEPTPSWAQGLVDAIRASNKRQPEVYENPAGVRITEKGGTVRPVPSNNPNYVPGGGTPESITAIIAENAPGHTGPTPLTDAWMKVNTENPWTPQAQKARVGPARRDVSHIESFFPGAERAHEFNWPREMQLADKMELFRQRWRRGARNAAEHKRFDYRYTTKSGETIKTEGKFRDIINEIEREYDTKAATVAENRALRILGRDPTGSMSEPLRKLQNVEGVLTTGSKLIGSVVQIPQQLSQLGNQFIEGGIGPVAEGTAKAAMSPFESIRTAKAKGRMQPDAFLHAMDLTQEGAAGVPMRLARAAVKVGQAPQQAIDAFSRAAASEGAQTMYDKVQAAYQRGGVANRIIGRDASWADRQLLRLDLSMADRQAIKGGTATPEQFNRFAQAWTRYTNNEAGIPEMPRIVGELGSDPRLAWARRFMSWSMGQGRFFKESVVQEAAHGNVAPLARFVAATIIVNEAIQAARRGQGAIVGREQVGSESIIPAIANRDGEAVKKYATSALTQSGMLGVWSGLARTASGGRPVLPPAITDLVRGVGAAIDTVKGDKELGDIWWPVLEKAFPQVNRWMGAPRMAEKQRVATMRKMLRGATLGAGAR